MSVIVLDQSEYAVRTPEKTVFLTPKEFGILGYLVQNEGMCAAADEIYRAVWQAEPFRCKMLIAVHICHIREKIEPDPAHPRYLKRVRGKGYMFKNE